MAIAALNSAATGLKALSTKIDVIANNLANAETQAFKRSRVNFEDLMYVTERSPGSKNAQGDVAPAGIQIGLGTKVSNTQIDFSSGSVETTKNQYDLAIQGDGFYKIAILDSIGGGEGYTRNGNFFRNRDGDLVVGQKDGYRLEPSINIPNEAVSFAVSEDGAVTYTRADGTTSDGGQITLSRFVNPHGLKQIGGNIYIRTDASGPELQGKPGDEGFGSVQQGVLETSNVDPVIELVSLIKVQKAFELNSQSIQTADQALETISNLRRY